MEDSKNFSQDFSGVFQERLGGQHIIIITILFRCHVEQELLRFMTEVDEVKQNSKKPPSLLLTTVPLLVLPTQGTRSERTGVFTYP